MAYADYWIKRADARMAEIQAGSDQTIQDISEAYDSAMKQLNKDIDRLFFRFAGKNGLTPEQAKELLSETLTSQEVDSIRSQIDMIQDPDIKRQLYTKLDATISRSRISRLEALKEDIYIQTSKMADVELQRSTARYFNIIQDDYLHNVFDCQQYLNFAYSFSKIPVNTINEILKDNWSGKHYSKRLWENSMVNGAKIEDTVKKLLLKGTLTGTNSRKLAKELDKITNTGTYACERLIRTESTYFVAMADLEAAKRRGTKRIRFVATLDDRTSEECRDHDGNIINIEDAVPGKTIPPLHPFCRSVIIDVIEGLVHRVRTARNPVTGKNYKVPADMTYREWEKMVSDEHIMSDTGSDKYEVDTDYIDSQEYHDKYSNLTGSVKADEAVYSAAKGILKRRSGTRTEELYFFDKKSGKLIGNAVGTIDSNVKIPQELKVKLIFKKDNSVVVLHNHPSNSPFSLKDFSTNSKYPCISDSIVAGHGGSVYLASNVKYTDAFEECYTTFRDAFVSESNMTMTDARDRSLALTIAMNGGHYERR
ncbi:MAG: minor capsid protein [Lachnospiraceae bacterium]|nr:minor capsid protein [Lachnospiraceae bacterium]